MLKFNWSGTYRKQILVHGLILLAFLLYCIFGAVPLFDVLGNNPAEAKLMNISLPSATNNVVYQIEEILFFPSVIKVRGWASIVGHVDKDSQIYIVLNSTNNSYVFRPAQLKRPEIAQALNLPSEFANLGFSALIPVNDIAQGTYRLGIYIKQAEVEDLQYTDDLIIKSDKTIVFSKQFSVQQFVDLPPETIDITYYIDSFRRLTIDTNIFIELVGWAFVCDYGMEGSNSYIVLKSEDQVYVFNTVLQKRPDVTAALGNSNMNLDNSGFIARIPADEVKGNIYKVGFLITRNDIRNLHYTNTFLYKSGDIIQRLDDISTLQAMSLPQETGDITTSVDNIKETVNNSLRVQEISGYAFISGRSAEGSSVYILLKSENQTYIFDTLSQIRPDVTAAYKALNVNLDNSGFTARIIKDYVKPGDYKLGIFIQNGNEQTFSFTAIIIKF